MKMLFETRLSGLVAVVLIACGGRVYDSTGTDPGGGSTSGGSGGDTSSSSSTSGGTSSSSSTSGGTSSGGPVTDPPNCVEWTPVAGVSISGPRAVRDTPYVFGSDEDSALRANKPQTKGRYFFEVDILSRANPGPALSLGIDNRSGGGTLAYCIYTSNGEWGDYRFEDNGSGAPYGANTRGTFRFAQGNTLGIGVDVDAKTMSLYINGALRETQNVQYCIGSEPMFPSVGLQVNDEVVGRFQNFRYPIAGYAPWGECN